jgi:DNA-binding CsgD family transcriptional regulator
MNIMKNSKKNSSPIYTQAWLSQIAAKVKAHGTDAHRMKAHSRYYLVNWFLRAKAGDAEFAYLLNDSNLTVKLTQNEKNVLGKVAGKVFTFSEISGENPRSVRGTVNSLLKKGVIHQVEKDKFELS